jgi:hypothetical protein
LWYEGSIKAAHKSGLCERRDSLQQKRAGYFEIYFFISSS